MSQLRTLNDNVRTVSTLPAGTNFARVALALHGGKEGLGARDFAAAQWGEKAAPTLMLRAAVSAATTGNTEALAEHSYVGREFVHALRPMTILGRLSGFRRVPARIKVPRATAGSTVSWAGEGKPIKVSRAILDTIELDHFKLAGIVATTAELARFSTPAAEELVRVDLLAATAAMTDQAFLDPDAAEVAGVSPASITYAAAKFTASGTAAENVVADLRLLFEELVGNGITMRFPYFLMSSRTAFRLSTIMTDGGLAFPGIGARGGELFGVPVLTSTSVSDSDESPALSNIVLMDAGELLLADSDEATIELSTQSTLQLDDAPDDPVTASTT